MDEGMNFMSIDELLRLSHKKAWSIPLGTNPSGLEDIGSRTNKKFNITYWYYQDKATGEFYFKDSLTERFEMEMQAARKTRKEKNRY